MPVLSDIRPPVLWITPVGTFRTAAFRERCIGDAYASACIMMHQRGFRPKCLECWPTQPLATILGLCHGHGRPVDNPVDNPGGGSQLWQSWTFPTSCGDASNAPMHQRGVMHHASAMHQPIRRTLTSTAFCLRCIMHQTCIIASDAFPPLYRGNASRIIRQYHVPEWWDVLQTDGLYLPQRPLRAGAGPFTRGIPPCAVSPSSRRASLPAGSVRGVRLPGGAQRRENHVPPVHHGVQEVTAPLSLSQTRGLYSLRPRKRGSKCVPNYNRAR